MHHTKRVKGDHSWYWLGNLKEKKKEKKKKRKKILHSNQLAKISEKKFTGIPIFIPSLK